MDAEPEVAQRADGRPQRVRRRSTARRSLGGNALQSVDDRDDAAPRRLGRVRRHRRAVRRDQGGPRRLLPGRGAPTSTRRSRWRKRGARSPPAASRCARSWCSTEPTGMARRGGRGARSPTRTVASGASSSPRRCASPATSTWPRNASRTRTRGRCATWAEAGDPVPPGGVADHDGAQPGAGPDAPRRAVPPRAAGAGRWTTSRRPPELGRRTRSPTTGCG